MITRVDRAALVRRAVVDLVADVGIHGTTMSQVAGVAGVATGTAYVHYRSKDDLLIAAFVEVKTNLGHAAVEGVDLAGEPRQVFDSVWRNVYTHLRADPALARFLVQVEVSPLRQDAHDALAGEPLTETARMLARHLVDLPLDVLYDLALAPAVRLAAAGTRLGPEDTVTLIEACWRAVSR
ncbi:MAG TPA: TetR/AcrR family transcriptional regulator [Acidimicrobiia bacterium]|nr:TetR/AcrR family transcriptional regulator [Acidimicrobiia bacterium]